MQQWEMESLTMAWHADYLQQLCGSELVWHALQAVLDSMRHHDD